MQLAVVQFGVLGISSRGLRYRVKDLEAHAFGTTFEFSGGLGSLKGLEAHVFGTTLDFLGLRGLGFRV